MISSKDHSFYFIHFDGLKISNMSVDTTAVAAF